ncbi:MAG: ABC transporter ATP-binding protein [Thermodesulfobacteriota bacterium]
MIRVENVTKYYGDFCAVDRINLEIQKGEILGLLGPNGAGKTTTLRMLTGYFLPTSGEVRVKNHSIRENMLEIKKMIGYLPESAPLYHGMLVYDFLDYVARIRGIENGGKVPRIRELVELCGLGNIMHRTIGELSKGLKQRVGLAHAMIGDPEILVLDEPTSGLDPNQIVEIREIIRRIGKEKTVILSTHILSEAEATCDRIVIINRGKIVADGSTETLKQSAHQQIIIKLSLLNADPGDIRGRLSGIAGITGVETNEGQGEKAVEVTISCGAAGDLRKVIYQAIKETDWILLEFRQEAHSLEMIFRELTKEK